MARTNILASGTSAANSSDVVINAGEAVTLSAFAAGTFPLGVQLSVMMKTTGGDQPVGVLSRVDGVQARIAAPGTYYIARGEINTAVGVDVER